MTKERLDPSEGGQAGVSHESSFGYGYDFLDVADKSLEGLADGFVRHPFNAAKTYLDSELVIECAFSVELGEGADIDLIAIVQRAHPFLRQLRDYSSAYTGVPREWRYNDRPVYGPYIDEQSVFVEQIEFVQKPKRVVPSLVWLQPSYEGGDLVCEILGFIAEVRFKEFLRLPERPSRLIGAGAGTGALAGDKIEGGSRVVDGVAGNGAKARWNGLFSPEPKNQPALAIPRFDILDDIVAVEPAMQCHKAAFKLRQVFLRPFNFGSGSEFWVGIERGHIVPGRPGFLVYESPEEARNQADAMIKKVTNPRKDQAFLRTVKRMLETPPKPHTAKAEKPHSKIKKAASKRTRPSGKS